MTDAQLISAHLAGDKSAFETLVRRHLDMVHAAATRQAPDFADDITQAVFLLLHQKASSLRNRPNLAGWLFTTTRLCANHARRAAHRRRIHEREAAMQNQTVSPDPVSPEPSDHAALLPLLDTALASLPTQDRDLIIQRHLQNRPLETIAAELSLSVPAATKRAQRAVERLRDWFSGHGHNIPASSIASVLFTQSAHHAPAALASAHAANSATAAAIAKSTAPLLFSTTLKLAAAAASLAIIAGAGYAAIKLFQNPSTPGHPIAAVPAPAAPVASPAVVDGESKLPGQIRLARFDAPMTAAAAEEFKKLLIPIETPSNTYVGYRASNDAVISGLRQTFATGQFIPSWAHPSIVFSETAPDAGLPFRIEEAPVVDWQGRRTFFNDRWGGNLRGTAVMSAADDSLRLMIDLTDAGNGPRGALPAGANATKSIRFNGSLRAGESLLFFADVSQTVVPEQLVHIVLWQAFKATDDQMQTITKIDDSVDWIKRGPNAARTLADRAMVWHHRAPEKPIHDKFAHQFANGATIRFLALGSPDEFPHCWWRPDGAPSEKDWIGPELSTDYNTRPTAPPPPHAMVFELEVPGLPKSDQPLASKSPQTVRYFNQSHVEIIWPIRTDLGAVEVGVAAGPWKDFLSIPGPAEVNKDKIALRFRPLNTSGHNDITCTIDFQAPPEMEVRVLAIDRGGKPLRSAVNNNAPEDWPSITLVRAPADTWQSLNLNLAGPLDIIDHFLIQTRKREWTTFSDYATIPTTPIPETPDPAELAAIRQRLAK